MEDAEETRTHPNFRFTHEESLKRVPLACLLTDCLTLSVYGLRGYVSCLFTSTLGTETRELLVLLPVEAQDVGARQ